MFQPFPYQGECKVALHETRKKGKKRALVVMASGLGKTVTSALDFQQWLQEHPGRLLYLCHQNYILYQARTTFEAVLGNNRTYGFFTGEDKTHQKVDCLFASLQTMAGWYTKFDPYEFDYIIVDESHHSHAETFVNVIRYFQPKFLLGLTATPDRLDRLNIRSLYGPEVFYLPLERALARGLLTPVDYRLMSDEIRLNGILETPIGQLSISYLNRKVFIPKRDEEVAKIIQKHAAEFATPRIIIFCSSVKHAEHLAKFIPDSFTIHSRIPSKERNVRMELFKQGIISTVITVDCFNEGVDIPQANVIVFMRSTESATIFLQQLGRGLRRSEGKDRVVVLDFVGNCERIKYVYNLWKGIKKDRESFAITSGPTDWDRGRMDAMTLNVENVSFDEKIVKMLDIIGRLEQRFYETWQEAGKAAKALGIQSAREYRQNYKKDPKLPSNPNSVYQDFPPWSEFLDTDKIEHYSKWPEATEVIRALGIKSQKEYFERYREDPKLWGAPHAMYPDFPGYNVYLGLKYATCLEASRAAIALNIKTRRAYERRYKEDSRLYIDPHRKYADFPGWSEFLGPQISPDADRCETWEQAAEIARELGVKSRRDYEEKYKLDGRLPSNPRNAFNNFPGWETFLGPGARKCATWQEASQAIAHWKQKSVRYYYRHYWRNPKLYKHPDSMYPDFPGWPKFLGKE